MTKKKKRTPVKRVPPTNASSSWRGVPINRLLALEKLKAYFQIDLDIARACAAYNTKARDEFMRRLAQWRTKKEKPDYIARSTVQTWYEQDDTVRHLIDSWKDTTNILARQSWQQKISKWDYLASKEWLERREKKDFSTKSEIWFTDPDGKAVTPTLYIPDNGRK